MNVKKKSIAIVAVIAAAAIATGIFCYKKTSATETSTVTKETTVEKGNLTTGVTESGSVTVGTTAQAYDLDLSFSSSGSSSSSSSSSGSSSSSSSSSGSGSSSAGGAGGTDSAGAQTMSMTGSTGSTATGSTSGSTSSSSSVSLEVEEVYASVGQTLSVGDPVLKLTQESVTKAQEAITSAIEDATLDLQQAKITDQNTKLSAQNDYDASVAAGSVAESVYNATIAEIDNNIASLQTQIAAETDASKLTTLQSQLEKAQSEEASKKQAAKQTYEETMLSYNNASELYQVEMASVGDAVDDAQETLSDLQETKAAFEALVGSDCIVTSDYAGVVVTVGYAAGDTLSSATSIVEIADDTAVTISVSVTQDDISVVNIGDSVNIDFTAYADNTYTGTVSEIGTADTSSSTVSYPITITLSDLPEKTLTGMTANVTFVTEEVKDVLYVSNKAVTLDGTTSYVVKQQEDGTTQQTVVETGFSDGINVEITSGLDEGDTVLIESQVSE